MLYVFNSADSVKIAWNGVLPSEKATSRRPFKSFLNNIIRTASAG